MVPLAAAGYGPVAPWMRLFLLLACTDSSGLSPQGFCPTACSRHALGFPDLVSISQWGRIPGCETLLLPQSCPPAAGTSRHAGARCRGAQQPCLGSCILGRSSERGGPWRPQDGLSCELGLLQPALRISKLPCVPAVPQLFQQLK